MEKLVITSFCNGPWYFSVQGAPAVRKHMQDADFFLACHPMSDDVQTVLCLVGRTASTKSFHIVHPFLCLKGVPHTTTGV